MYRRVIRSVRSTLIISILVVPVTAQGQVSITTCGQILDGAGELVGNLNCPESENAIVIEAGGSLYLNGFTVNGSDTGLSSTIWCRGKCKIFGPGTVTGSSVGICGDSEAGAPGCRHANDGQVNVRDVTVVGAGDAGIRARRMRLENVTIVGYFYGAWCARAKIDASTFEDNRYRGIYMGGPLSLKGSLVTGTGDDGVEAGKSKIKDSIIANNAGSGFRDSYGGNKVRIVGSTVNDNDRVGIAASDVRVRLSTISGNGLSGISTKSARIHDSTVTSNGESGVLANGGGFALKNSTIVGNCVVGASGDCADIKGCPPRFENTICDTSLCMDSCDVCPNGPGGNLGVCAAD